MKMKVGFDFDSTLDTEQMQKLCKQFLVLGANVFVVTSRGTKMYGSKAPINNDDLFEVTDVLGIKREHIVFTEHNDKYSSIKDLKLDLFFDDDFEEIFLINEHPMKCMGFVYEEKNTNGIKYY